jgi:hypothetical protein
VTFFGLFPYRLLKAMLNSSVIPLWSILFLAICFFIIWKFINNVIPYVFNTFVGQFLVACSLSMADKLLFLFDTLKEKPVITGFSLVSFILALSCYWITWGIPSFFFLTVVQSYMWYKNFKKHFLQGEAAEAFKKDTLCFKLPKDNSDFKWKHIIYLMHFVVKYNHKCIIVNQLAPLFDNLALPNIAKRYFYVDETTSHPKLVLTHIVSTSLITICGWLLIGRPTKRRVSHIETMASRKKDFDIEYEKEMRNLQEKIQEYWYLSNKYSYEHTTIKKKLESLGIKNPEILLSSNKDTTNVISRYHISNLKDNFLKWWNQKINFEIEILAVKFDMTRMSYMTTVSLMKKFILKQACIKKIVDRDVRIIDLNPLEKFYAVNKDTTYCLDDLGLNPSTLQEKAEKSEQIQNLLEEALSIKECIPLDLDKVEKLGVKISPLLDPIFLDYQQEFVNNFLRKIEMLRSKEVNSQQSSSKDTIEIDSFWEA